MERAIAHGDSGKDVDSYVVVAIPKADDDVWKVSSEKVPHMTLLYLDGSLENVEQVAAFIKHACDTSLGQFTVGVKSRGPLGDKSADVLFFTDYTTEFMGDFRSYLRGNTDIEKAYQSAEQFPQWTPHLTLGYPETPPKIKPEDHLPFYSVTFDRIALWTGEYEGVEFPLPERDMAVAAMSDRVNDFLAHYGIKGMRWGVRRAEGPDGRVKKGPAPVEVNARLGRRVKTKGGQRQPAADDAIRVATIKQRAKKSTVDSLSNRELQELVTRLNLEQQYSRLNTSTLDRGSKLVKELIGIGKQSKEAYNVGSTLLSDIRKSS